MTVKINVKEELGISKSIYVKESNANMRKTFEFQKDLSQVQIRLKKQQIKIDKASDEDKAAQAQAAMFDIYLDQLSAVQKYIVDMLKLDEAHQEKLDVDFDFNATIDLGNKISAAILRIDPVDSSEEGDDLKA